MLFGPDVSNYQRGIDMTRVRRDGCDFASAKASQGSSYRSPSYAAQRDGAIRAGMIFYSYHYVDTSDPAAQVRNYLRAEPNRGIACMLDWEKDGGNGPWLRRVVAAFRAAGIRLAPIYAPKWYWQQVGSPDLSGLGSLVASSYPSTKGGDEVDLYRNVTAKRWAGYGGLSVALLQFTDRANIAGMAIDCNAYPGSREQLTSLLYGTPVAPTAAPVTRRRRYREAANDMRDEIKPVYTTNSQGDPAIDLTAIVDGRFTGPFGGGSATIEAGWVTCSNNVGMILEFWCERSVNGVKTGIPNGHFRWAIGPGDAPSFRIPDGANWVYYQASGIAGAGDVAIDIRPRP